MTLSNINNRFANVSTAEIGLQILIRPGIPPKKRHVIEDALMEAGCEVAGGGGFNDGTESDISVFVDSVKGRLPMIMSILQKAKIGTESIVCQDGESRVEYPVYASAETWLSQIPPESNRPWWKFW